MNRKPWSLLRARVLLPLVILALLAACGPGSAAKPSLRVLSGSENRTLEPVVEQFERDSGVSVEFTYKGSVDIQRELERGAATEYDAVWPASSLWIALGDTGRVVRNQQSIMRSPVVLGVKRSVAQRLGWVDREVSVADILAAAEGGRLRFTMTSATQSNSGAAAYLGYLYAFAGNPDVLQPQHLRDPVVAEKVTRILGAVNRSAGSSGWLKDLFLQRYDSFDAMVNYEALVIETNQELVKTGREPLYAVYPRDGLSIADSPLGYVNRGDAAKEEAFKKLQEYLLTPSTQEQILGLGRRVGPLGLSPENADPAVFNPEWGIDVRRLITPVKVPQPEVIREALNLYQTAFRKPSFTVYGLDFSGSMAGRGEEDLKAAMRTLLDQREAGKLLLQASPRDIHVVIPFNQDVTGELRAEGNAAPGLDELVANINQLEPGGETNIYAPVMRGLDILEAQGHEGYSAAIILMTDGRANAGRYEELQRHIEQLGSPDIPVYAILFGDASDEQLKQITELTGGRVFDGRENLIEGFREAKGYN